MTGTVDDEAWQSFEKILADLPELKINFDQSKLDTKLNSFIVFNDGKRMRHIAINRAALAKKTGVGKLAFYTLTDPLVQSPLFGSIDVPQSALGAWYELNNFVPKDAKPWFPENFDVSLMPCTESESIPWPTNWPQLEQAEKHDFGGYSLQMSGSFLSQFQKLFNRPLMFPRISGQAFLMGCTTILPGEQMLAATPMGFNYEAPVRLPLLPNDFLQKTKLADVKKIARERKYEMHRLVSYEPGSLENPDIIEMLCHSKDLDEIDAGLELKLEAGWGAERVASIIASTHSPEITKTLILRHIADSKFLKIIIPLIQEAVARGANYDAVEPISTFWNVLRLQGEPLTWLPLHRLDIEQSTNFPHYGGGGSAVSISSNTVNGKLEKPPSVNSMGKPFTAVPLPFDVMSAAQCVREWKENSNGKFEAKLFQSTAPISITDVSAKQLLNLQLECFSGATLSDLKVDEVKADCAFALLFSAASVGGAYPSGKEGAYGRLAAWKSLAALVGVADGANFDEVANAAKQSSWCSIHSKAKWFYNVAWDFGIVCLRPDKRHIAVLAATDED